MTFFGGLELVVFRMSINSRVYTFRLKDVAYYLVNEGELRQKVTSRFFKDEMTILRPATYGKLFVEIDESKLEIMKNILYLHQTFLVVKKILSSYIERKISLDELYTKLYPYIIAKQLKQ
jgi:hypothetical protein